MAHDGLDLLFTTEKIARHICILKSLWFGYDAVLFFGDHMVDDLVRLLKKLAGGVRSMHLAEGPRRAGPKPALWQVLTILTTAAALTGVLTPPA